MSRLAARADAPVLTIEGRRRVEQRLARVLKDLEAADQVIKQGQADAQDLAARSQLASTADELRRLLEDAADVTSVDEDPAIVEVGDAVDVAHEDGDVETYFIVHAAEADADENRISAASPLGSALLGARPGQQVTVTAPAGIYSCTVVARRRLT